MSGSSSTSSRVQPLFLFPCDHEPAMIRLYSLLFLLLLFPFVGCKPNAMEMDAEPFVEPPPPTIREQVTLQLNWFPEAEHGGFFAALVHGYYRAAGLDVEILPGGPDTPVMPQVATGRAMFGVSNADNVLFGRAQGAPVVALAAPLQTSPRCLIVHESSGIKDFTQLKDMTLAMNPSMAFAQYLKKKVPLEGVQIVPYPGNVAQFLQDKNYGQQGYVFSEPLVARKQGGDPHVLMLSDLGFNPYTSLLITSEEVLQKSPRTVAKMVSATVRGWAKYVSEPAESNKQINKVNPEMDLETLEFGAEAIRPLVKPAEGAALCSMTTFRWQTLLDQLVETGQIEKEKAPDVKRAFTLSFMPRLVDKSVSDTPKVDPPKEEK